jgi:hypothetical protein
MANQVKRDAFTLPAEDCTLIQTLRKKCMKQGVDMNKSEIVRLGIHALQSMKDTDLIKIASQLPKIKTGRPSKN